MKLNELVNEISKIACLNGVKLSKSVDVEAVLDNAGNLADGAHSKVTFAVEVETFVPPSKWDDSRRRIGFQAIQDQRCSSD